MTIIIKYTSDIATQAHVVPQTKIVSQPALSTGGCQVQVHTRVGYDTKWCILYIYCCRIYLLLNIAFVVHISHRASMALQFICIHYLVVFFFFCSFNSLRLIRQLKLKSWSWAAHIGQLLGWFCREYIARVPTVGFSYGLIVFERFGAKKEFRANGWWSRFLSTSDYSGLKLCGLARFIGWIGSGLEEKKEFECVLAF